MHKYADIGRMQLISTPEKEEKPKSDSLLQRQLNITHGKLKKI